MFEFIAGVVGGGAITAWVIFSWVVCSSSMEEPERHGRPKLFHCEDCDTKFDHSCVAYHQPYVKDKCDQIKKSDWSFYE